MNQIQIPVVTTMGKFIVIGYCLLIVVAVLYWGLPKFNVFLHVVFGRSKRPQGVKGIYLIFGFAVYACIFALAALATNIGLDVATAAPTLISSQGVIGGQIVCHSAIGVVGPFCSIPLKPWGNSQKMIRWEDIGRVGCLSRHDGTIRELQIDAGARRIEVGSLGVCDLSAAYAVILAHSPRGTAQACHEAWDQ